MTAMAPARTAPDLSFLLDHTSHVLRSQMSAALAEIGLTARMHCVLVHALEEERTQIQLAELGDMDKTTMVVTVDALEKAGLAERRPSSKDRRARIIAVTEKGAQVAEESQKIVDAVHDQALGSLPSRSARCWCERCSAWRTAIWPHPQRAGSRFDARVSAGDRQADPK